MTLAAYKEAARPTAVYGAVLITMIVAVAMICGRPIPAGVTMELLGPVWAYAGYYASQRTKENIAAQQQSNGNGEAH